MAQVDLLRAVKELMRLGRVFTFEEAEERIGNVERKTLYGWIERLIEAGIIRRIDKGIYMFTVTDDSPVNPLVLPSLIAKPSMITYRTALEYYGLLPEEGSVIYAQTLKGPHGERIIAGHRFYFVRTTAKVFFGHKKEKIEGREVLFARPEKAIVDCIDRPDLCNGLREIIPLLLLEEINVNDVVRYARMLGRGRALKRLGYILERLGIETEEEVTITRAQRSNKILLDPTRPAEGSIDDKWGIVVNVPSKYFLE